MVDYRYYNLHNDYRAIGSDTEIERKILKHWFVVQYTVYLLSILIWFVRLIKPVFTGVNNDLYDFIHSLMYILYDSFAFLVPYLMATWLNKEHTQYHREMKETLLK